VTDTPLFDFPAEGELFDCRPLEAKPASVEVASPPASYLCPACGRDTLTPGHCPRCVTNGHTALTMEEG
jgi:hypothetical protein